MIDFLLLVGVVLCVILVFWVVVLLFCIEVLCGVVVMLVLGIVVLFVGSVLDEWFFGIESFGQLWQCLVSGESFGMGSIIVLFVVVIEDQGVMDVFVVLEFVLQVLMQGNGGEVNFEVEFVVFGVEVFVVMFEVVQFV